MFNTTQISALAITCLFAFACLPTHVLSAPRDGLFQSAQGQAAKTQPSRNALPGKSRAVKVDKAAMGKGRLRLNLGVGPELDVVRERLVERGNGRRAWIGRVNGDSDSQVILVSSGNAVAGTIRHQGRLYKLEPGRGGSQRLEEVSPNDPLPSTEMLPDLPGIGAAASAPTTAGDGANVVDILVAYTPEAKITYGGTDGINALIGLAVEETNQAYLNSAAPVQLRLVGAVETDYHDSGDMNSDLVKLTTNTDGFMEELHGLRDSLGADLVSLIVDSGSYCGLSWQMGMLNPAYASYAFNVVKASCATGYYSFGHEIGHNLGLSHDHANATSGLFPYSYGWQEPTSAFRTIMAYTCTVGCTRVQHFSNPEIDYAGAATGEIDYADNALALADTAPLVATWRESLMPYPPIAPSSLAAVTVSYDRIDLSWSDDATDEDGYQVERSEDGQNYSLIATLAADSVDFADQPLNPETTYYYRVSAYNGAGVSSASNDAWATTEAAPIAVPTAPSALNASALSHTEIALSWSDNASDETGYELERSVDDGANWNLLASLGENVSAYTDQGLTPSSSYSYRVRATGVGDASAYSNIASALTDAQPVYPPTAPSTLGALALSETEIVLSWTDNASDETGFELERSSDGGMNWTLIAAPSANASGYTDTGLSADSYYLYRIRAIGEGGPSDYSDASGATTLAPVPETECSVQGAASLTLGDRDMKWNITNTAGNAVTISRIQISWPSSQGDLKKISLDGSQLWSGSDAPTSADISANWTDTNALVLSAGQTETLDFDFKRRDKKDSQSDYSITVYFNEGCNVSF